MEEEVKAKVRAVLALMREEFKCAYWYGLGPYWVAFDHKPESAYELVGGFFGTHLAAFDLPPFPGDWKDSMVTR